MIVYDNFFRGSMDNLAAALEDPRVSIFPHGGDILHRDILEKAMEGIDGVFHLAALWILQCHEYPETAFEVNVRGTFNVIMAAIRQKVKRVVYSSSASVYGDALEIPMDEDHAYNNFTFYGASKIAGEHFFKSLGRRYGLNWVGLRYMNVYGPRQDYKGAYIAVMHKILDRIERGQSPLVYGDGSQQYDFVHVSRRRPGERAGHAGRRPGALLQRRPRRRHHDQGTDRTAAAADRQRLAHPIRAGRADLRDQPHRLSASGPSATWATAGRSTSKKGCGA